MIYKRLSKRSNSHLHLSGRYSLLKCKRSQISMEYIVILGFVLIVIIGILGVALFYSGSIKDQMKTTQVSNFAHKLISTAESVYYYGEPSKATISVYLPEGVKDITIASDQIYISTQMNSGIDKSSFSSNVPLEGVITTSSGIRKIVIKAEGNKTRIDSL